jgi:hypothetical protein
MEVVHTASQAQGEFLTWLQEEKHYILCGHPTCKWAAAVATVEKLLAEFHGIDLNKVEKERRALLDFLRNQKQ